MSGGMDRKVKIKLADDAGFCSGVRRAIKIIREMARREGRALSYGDLIHNRRVMAEMESLGVKVIQEVSEVDGPTVTRAHGITSRERRQLMNSGFEVIDATCPLVNSIKDGIDKAYGAGALVVILGNPVHVEVVGLVDGRLDIIVARSAEDLDQDDLIAKLEQAEKVALFSQSTQRSDHFDRLAEKLCEINPNTKLHNTICKPTKARQAGAVRLAGDADVMIVVGDEHSSNSKRLVETAAEIVVTHRVSGADDIRPEWFDDDISLVGVAAGASAPDRTISEVLNKLQEMLEGEIVT